MPALDGTRFVHTLAGALLGVHWVPAALAAATAQVLAAAVDVAGRPPRIPGLVDRLLDRHATPPTYRALVITLGADAGVARALARMAATRPRARPSAASGRAKPTMDAPPPGLAGVQVPALATEAALADWLGISVGRLRWLADLSGRNRRHPPGPLRPYRYVWISKAGGGHRLLEVPTAVLKRVQRQILDGILTAVAPHPAAHGFCPGRSVVTNAAPHCGKAVVLRFDLTDFFPSVPPARVLRVFRTVGYPRPVARLLAGLCTTRLPADVWAERPSRPRQLRLPEVGAGFAAWQLLSSRHLPQGAPTSPALANLAAHRLDRRLSRQAAAAGADYTRYADDLTFSGGDALRRSARRLAARVVAIAADEGFAVNHRKTRAMTQSTRQHVAGVVVNVRPNVPRDEFDRLKAILTNCARHGPASQNRGRLPHFREHLTGRVAQVGAVNAARGAKLRALLGRVQWDKIR
jgi:RNA-directed DNA polymerase